ncbi:hypothetical protein J2S10_002520 [Neobacillus ginsengisoli]|uniref:Uncharacterized protein n=1 Tax=Neobacillus ginsengisoli TaxID=904295 RepID=A0ABT9XUV1_9BACI|nr:hypothetical protein [Neobacillus ginsengisoli]
MESLRQNDVLEAIICPSKSDIRLRWHNAKRVLASLHLADVKGLRSKNKTETSPYEYAILNMA